MLVSSSSANTSMRLGSALLLVILVADLAPAVTAAQYPAVQCEEARALASEYWETSWHEKRRDIHDYHRSLGSTRDLGRTVEFLTSYDDYQAGFKKQAPQDDEDTFLLLCCLFGGTCRPSLKAKRSEFELLTRTLLDAAKSTAAASSAAALAAGAMTQCAYAVAGVDPCGAEVEGWLRAALATAVKSREEEQALLHLGTLYLKRYAGFKMAEHVSGYACPSGSKRENRGKGGAKGDAEKARRYITQAKNDATSPEVTQQTKDLLAAVDTVEKEFAMDGYRSKWMAPSSIELMLGKVGVGLIAAVAVGFAIWYIKEGRGVTTKPGKKASKKKARRD